MGRSRPYGIFNLLIGALIMFVNLYWIEQHATLYWLYHYTTVNFVYMLPDWALFIQSASGILGIYLSIQVIENKVGPWKGLLLQFAIMILWTLLDFFYHNLSDFLGLY